MFVNDEVLILLVLLPALGLFLAWGETQRRKAAARIGPPDLVALLGDAPRQSRRASKALLWLLTVAALIIALARPVWGTEVDPVETVGVSVMLVLDVSRSMDVQDIAPSRLERARLDALDLLRRLEGNEFGLILFAGTAFVQFPLTTDARSAAGFVNGASSDSISQQGTNIEAALRLAVEGFRPESPSQGYIVLLTDGESHEGDAQAAARVAVDAGIPVVTIGYGTEAGGPVPILGSDGLIAAYRQERSGELAISRLDERLLENLANDTGGFYVGAEALRSEIERIAQFLSDSAADGMDQTANNQGIERFGVFIALALIALGLEIILPESARGRGQ